jgi:hypothetical protein
MPKLREAAERLPPSTAATRVRIASNRRLMIRTIIDDRITRAWAILFGMLVMATMVGGVTIVLHDRVALTRSADVKSAFPHPAPSAMPVTPPISVPHD